MERSICFERTVAVDHDAAVAALRDRPEDVVLDDPGAGTLVLHAQLAGFDVARAVTVTLGELHQLDRHAVVLPVSWQATEHPQRFPTFTGVIELSALSQALSQLALVGTVTAPLGVLGSFGEAVGGTQLADSVLEALVERLEARLVGVVADRAALAAAAVTPSHMSRPRIELAD